MDTWTNLPTFGAPPENGDYTVRPSAYALLRDPHGMIALVRTDSGYHLPGGKIDEGETPDMAVVRETIEECALEVTVGPLLGRAVEYRHAESEDRNYEMHNYFLAATTERSLMVESEEDHELLWFDPTAPLPEPAHPSHRWALEELLGATVTSSSSE